MNELTSALPTRSTSVRRPHFLERALRAQVLERLQGLHRGLLTIEEADTVIRFGNGAASPRVCVRVLDPALYTALALRGSVGAAEAFMDGAWECDDLVALVRILVLNRDILEGLDSGLARIAGAVLRVAHGLRRNTLSGSRRNIAAHYDLGNEFFGLFLSPDLMYSSALFETPEDTLERASTTKLERICSQLQLTAADHVLEIGTGWGGFAEHAASRHGCRVTTTTISHEQHRFAVERIARAGLSNRVTVLLKDYRELTGQYDKLVSIEMIEAVGAEYLPTYFEQVRRLLKPEGLALLQAITIEDHGYLKALRAVDFIKAYIFPGSFIPSINAMLAAKTQVSDLALIRLEDFGLSYALTLAAWRKAFLEHRSEARAQGFDEPFLRMWEFYLAYCEGGFRERSIGVAHLLFAGPEYRPHGV
jgi:cyclopropane-fatty-acyl-phospholipid synthase